ncbi:MAG: hypothetical protein ACSHXF_07940 [Aquaticitalea sp.]
MKTLKITIVLTFLLVLTPNLSNSQDAQPFMIHVDQVKPSMISEYETITKEFNQLCKTNDFKGDWSVAEMINGKYLTIVPIEKLADIENFSFAGLIEKIGEEKFKSYFDRWDKCYDKHGSYVTLLDHELSYMPDGMGTLQEGQDYRTWNIISVTPQNRAKMVENIKIIKELFISKKSKMHYRIYSNGFGQMGDSFVVVISAKDELDMAQKNVENRKLLGEESRAKFDAVFNLASEYEEVTGRMRPDLSYLNN